MPRYRRALVPGGTFFLTLVTHQRRPVFADVSVHPLLRAAIADARSRRPFDLIEIALLPDHLHLILGLPEGDADFSVRVMSIKAGFTRRWLDAGGIERAQSDSRVRQRYRAVWQKRFWEHCVSDETDLIRCRKYAWFNPVKHRLCACPHAWAHTTFHQAVRNGWVDVTWGCACGSQSPRPPADIPGAEMD